MKLRAEITEWSDNTRNGIYLTNDSGDKVFAYSKKGSNELQWFIKPLQIETRGRKFLDLYRFDDNQPEGKKVVGSKGDVYYVLDGKCTCPGFKFRGVCKHV